MKILISWLVSTLVVMAAAYIIPGVHVATFTAALVTALVLGVINLFIKPLILILTLPITIVTFGLFALVINALMILIASAIVPGFSVDGFWWALLFSLTLSIINSFINSLDD